MAPESAACAARESLQSTPMRSTNARDRRPDRLAAGRGAASGGNPRARAARHRAPRADPAHLLHRAVFVVLALDREHRTRDARQVLLDVPCAEIRVAARSGSSPRTPNRRRRGSARACARRSVVSYARLRRRDARDRDVLDHARAAPSRRRRATAARPRPRGSARSSRRRCGRRGSAARSPSWSRSSGSATSASSCM